MKSLPAKHCLLDPKEFVIESKWCILLDLRKTEVRMKVYWMPYDVTNDTIRSDLEGYGTEEEVSRETGSVDDSQGIDTTTRCVRLKLKDGVMVEVLPHQLQLFSDPWLVVVQGSAPVCFKCKRSSGNVRRDCRVPRCDVSAFRSLKRRLCPHVCYCGKRRR